MNAKWICKVLVALACAGASGVLPAQGREFPVRPVRLVVPFPPGGSLDVVARPLSVKMSELMKQQVVVNYRAGASGNIGTELVARAPSDGYTILINTLPLVVNPSLYSKLPFDVVKDFAPVSLLAAGPFVLVVHPSVPARSVKELIALAKARPGKVTYASAGSGTNLHVAAELFKNLTRTDILHIPYKGGGPALAAILSGESDLSFLGVVPASPYVAAGRMRALGVTGLKRSAVLAGVPTVSEAGVRGYEFASWWGIVAPAATPGEVVAALNGYIVKAMRSPDLDARLSAQGAEVIASSPQEFGKHLRAELAKYARVVRENRLKVE